MAGTYSQEQLELKFNSISERLAAIEHQLKVRELTGADGREAMEAVGRI